MVKNRLFSVAIKKLWYWLGHIYSLPHCVHIALSIFIQIFFLREMWVNKQTKTVKEIPCEIIKPWSWLTISFSRGRYYGRTSRLERTAGRQLSVAIFVQIFFFRAGCERPQRSSRTAEFRKILWKLTAPKKWLRLQKWFDDVIYLVANAMLGSYFVFWS